MDIFSLLWMMLGATLGVLVTALMQMADKDKDNDTR
jgi:hypothetical protein